ncbi:hypothetical protein GDO78_004021 [Eleutherodactylus coqui]|uniref:Uncharacterized protein n=1 Tax=Eleutherodactylus coqui TaxID=57060 RepID=A0A8J6ERH5_ELECQ|nr:hypothetical protein GDO78_004021 [Eleutherodactylus coqui]
MYPPPQIKCALDYYVMYRSQIKDYAAAFPFSASREEILRITQESPIQITSWNKGLESGDGNVRSYTATIYKL